MRSEKGITLVALTVYILGAIIVVSILTIISTYFYNNIARIKNVEENAGEFTSFNMFFLGDIKQTGIQVTSCSDTTIEFSNGVSYHYKNKSIYRNQVEVAKDVEIAQFAYQKDSITNKDMVTVRMALRGNKGYIGTTEYVLQYW